MRILAFSDLHLARGRAADIVAASAGADLVIGAGDFCTMRKGLDEAMAMLAGIAAPFVMVPGNSESVDELRAAGFNDREIFELTAFIGFRLAMSTINDALGLNPDWELAEQLPASVRDAIDFGRPLTSRPG